MQEKELPEGWYKTIIVNDPRKEKNNLKMKISEGEFAGITINITTVK